MMEVTNVHVSLAENKRMKALATITLGGEFVVHDLRIIDGPNGLFVAMPSKKTGKGTFRDVAHPITQTFRDKIEQAVIAEYNRLINSSDIKTTAQDA